MMYSPIVDITINITAATKTGSTMPTTFAISPKWDGSGSVVVVVGVMDGPGTGEAACRG